MALAIGCGGSAKKPASSATAHEEEPAQPPKDEGATKEPPPAAASDAADGGAAASQPNPDTAVDPDDENNPRVQAATELLKDEAIGGVHMGMSDKQVIAALGKPSKKGRAATEEATGDVVAQWEWKKVGIKIAFADAKKHPVVRSIQLDAGSKLKSKKGIGLGSTLEELEAAYGAGHRLSGEQPESTYIVGTLYYGMALELADDKVTSLYWGQLAE